MRWRSPAATAQPLLEDERLVDGVELCELIGGRRRRGTPCAARASSSSVPVQGARASRLAPAPRNATSDPVRGAFGEAVGDVRELGRTGSASSDPGSRRRNACAAPNARRSRVTKATSISRRCAVVGQRLEQPREQPALVERLAAEPGADERHDQRDFGRVVRCVRVPPLWTNSASPVGIPARPPSAWRTRRCPPSTPAAARRRARARPAARPANAATACSSKLIHPCPELRVVVEPARRDRPVEVAGEKPRGGRDPAGVTLDDEQMARHGANHDLRRPIRSQPCSWSRRELHRAGRAPPTARGCRAPQRALRETRGGHGSSVRPLL